jgi:sirohydrochlorin cobaltochelatase
VTKIIIVTTMITRGGSHSETEIPEELSELSVKYPGIDIQYAWPYDMDVFASFLTTHIKEFNPLGTATN